MLRGIRNASANWLGKSIMIAVVGFLTLSFGIWGVGDIFRGFGSSTVATVGSAEITREQFRQVYNDRMQQFAAQLGRPIPPDQARALGLDRQILSQVVAETALDEEARRLRLGVSDDEVARQIRAIPAFQGAGGQFDHALFEQRIRSFGYTEPRFVAEQRRQIVRRQLTNSISELSTVPDAPAQALSRFQNERRSIEYVTLGGTQAGDLPAPTAEELASYFEGQKARFRAPEYRKLALLKLASAEVAKLIEVSDEDARRAYEERRARYSTPSRRQVQQIVFPGEEEARAAKERIKSGASFEDVARERGLSEKDIDLGLVTKSGGLAPAVAEAAFALPEGGVSEPVQARAGTALVRVSKIEPEQARTFDEVKDEIKRDLARERVRAELNKKHDAIEDERAGGQTLAEAAQKVGLSATTIDAVDRSGRDPAGNPVPSLPTEADVLAPAFASAVGVEADPVRLPDGYLWFEVLGVTPSRERSFDDVKDQVEARWRESKIAERVKAKSAEIVEKLKGGTPLAELASANGLNLVAVTDIKRGGAAEGLSAAAVEAVYRAPKGGAASAEGQNGGEQIVFRVTDAQTPTVDLNTPEGKQIEEQLRTAMADDLLRQYLAEVQRQLGTRINADALRRTVGGETGGEVD